MELDYRQISRLALGTRAVILKSILLETHSEI